MNSERGNLTTGAGRRLSKIVLPVLLSVWLVGFCVYFFNQPLPNSGGLTRLDVWELWLWDLPTLGFGADDGLSAAPIDVLLRQRLPLMLAAATILLSSALAGESVRRPLLAHVPTTRAEKLVLAMAAGLSLQSLSTLVAGLCGCLSVYSVLVPGACGSCFSLQIVGATAQQDQEGDLLH